MEVWRHLLGLSVSLLPPPSLLLDQWRGGRFSHCTEFLLAVCVPAGFLATLIFLGVLARPASLLRMLSMAAICCVATVLWIAAVVAGLNLLYNAYYLLQGPTSPRRRLPDMFVSLETIRMYGFAYDPPWTLLALFLAVVFVSATALLAGWRLRRQP